MKQPKDRSPKVSQSPKLQNQILIKPFPWTSRQKEFIELALSKETKIVFVSGPAGCAKSLLSVYCALELMNQHKISDIKYIRSLVESSPNKTGYLPGDISSKVEVYGLPLMDKLGELLDQCTIKSLLKDGRIEVQPTNFLRGQNFNVKGIIIDEAQNISPSEMITALTRIGKFSKVFVCGDPDQCDLRGNSGAFYDLLDLFSDKESQEQGIFTFEFGPEDILRSELCKFLVKRFSQINAKPSV